MLHFYKFTKHTKIFFLITCIILLKLIESHAQSVTYKRTVEVRDPLTTQLIQVDTLVYIVSQPKGVCGQPTAVPLTQYLDGYFQTIDKVKTSDPQKRFRAEAGVTLEIIIEYRRNLFGTISQYSFTSLPDMTFAIENGNGGSIQYAKLVKNWESINVNGFEKKFTSTYSVTYGKSANLGYIKSNVNFNFRIGASSDFKTFGWQTLLPTMVMGQFDEPVAILGKAVQPMLPYMVLHAPPGDGSTAETAETKTVCREFASTYEVQNNHNAGLDVKIGFAGSAGLFVTTDFEFSTTFSAKLTAGDLAIKTNANQTCVTMSKGFSTKAMKGLEGGGDVFMGYGTDLDYGIYRMRRQDAQTCLVSIDSGLVYAPSSNVRNFFMTEDQIKKDIDNQRALAARQDTTSRARNLAANQADVWEKILAMNKANKDNPNNELIKDITFGGSLDITNESSISVVNTNSLEYQNYIDAAVGISFVIDIAGSGVSGGYEYTHSQRYGKTTTNSNETVKMVSYTLSDDDDDDKFDVKIVRDPMFGTPVFRIESSSQSSCPYQGGYKLDQPLLKHVGTSSDKITIQGAPLSLDSSAIFQIQVCNTSKENREYLLGLSDNSNPGGARLFASGFELNIPRTYNIPANGCKNITVEVKRLSTNSAVAYPDLELVLYPACESSISSSIFASVFFGAPSGVNDPTDNSLLSVFPNPTSDILQLSLPADKSIETINVMDYSGKNVLHFAPNASSSTAEIDMSDMTAGIYIIQLKSKDQVFVKKVVVQ